jgi:hypothetical protein
MGRQVETATEFEIEEAAYTFIADYEMGDRDLNQGDFINIGKRKCVGVEGNPCEKSGRRRAMGLNIEHRANGVSMGSTACAAHPQRLFLNEFAKK